MTDLGTMGQEDAGGDTWAEPNAMGRPAGSGPPDWRGPDRVLGWTLVQAGHLVGRRFTALLRASDLDPHQFLVLAQLVHDPVISQAALARSILITPQSMGAVLRRMEAMGLIKRTTPPTRGLAIDVALTKGGRALFDRVFPAMMMSNEPAAMGLTADEARVLDRLLSRVLASEDGAANGGDGSMEPADPAQSGG